MTPTLSFLSRVSARCTVGAAPEKDTLERDASGIGALHNAVHVALPVPGGNIAQIV